MRARSSGRATDREIAVVPAVLDAGSEKAAAHRLGLSHSTVKHHLANARSKVRAETTAQLVWILAQRLPEPGGPASGAQGLSSTIGLLPTPPRAPLGNVTTPSRRPASDPTVLSRSPRMPFA